MHMAEVMFEAKLPQSAWSANRCSKIQVLLNEATKREFIADKIVDVACTAHKELEYSQPLRFLITFNVPPIENASNRIMQYPLWLNVLVAGLLRLKPFNL